MGLNHSPKIVTDGLVFYYDMENTKKSWKGMPTTNQFTLPTDDVNGFGVQNSIFTRVRTGNYGGYEIKPTDYVWRYNITVNDCPYHGWDIPTTAGQIVTFSFDYYVDPSTTNYPITNYLANMENAGSGVNGAYADPTPSIKGVWKRAYFSSTATATGNSRCLFYPGGCGGRLGDAGFILYKNPQVEFNAPGSIPTPFVAGTRSTTQSIIDLMGNNTITASSLTYDSDGTFSFNGSSDTLSIPYNTLMDPTEGLTIECWVYPNNIAGLAYMELYRKEIGTGRQLFSFQDTGTILSFGTHTVSNGYHELDVSVSSNNYNSQWVHLVATYSSGYKSIFRNAEIIGSTTSITGNLVQGIAPFYVGSTGGGSEWFNGKISSIKIYNRSLTPQEVRQNYNASKSRYQLGFTRLAPAPSAAAIKAVTPDVTSGVYWLYSSSINNGEPFQCYCDFTMDGGIGYAIYFQKYFDSGDTGLTGDTGYEPGPNFTSMSSNSIVGTPGSDKEFNVYPNLMPTAYNNGAGATRMIVFNRSNSTNGPGIHDATYYKYSKITGISSAVMRDIWKSYASSNQYSATYTTTGNFGRTGGSGTVYITGSHGSGAGVYQWVANNPGNVNTNLVFEYKPIGYSEDASKTDPNHYWLVGNGDAADTYFRANGEYGASGVLQIRWGGIAIY